MGRGARDPAGRRRLVSGLPARGRRPEHVLHSGFELFVGGRSGTGAVDDNRRLCEFIYRNLGTITQVVPSLDTHHAMQVFHAIWLVDEHGNHPDPYTLISPRTSRRAAGG